MKHVRWLNTVAIKHCGFLWPPHTLEIPADADQRGIVKFFEMVVDEEKPGELAATFTVEEKPRKRRGKKC